MEEIKCGKCGEETVNRERVNSQTHSKTTTNMSFVEIEPWDYSTYVKHEQWIDLCPKCFLEIYYDTIERFNLHYHSISSSHRKDNVNMAKLKETMKDVLDCLRNKYGFHTLNLYCWPSDNSDDIRRKILRPYLAVYFQEKGYYTIYVEGIPPVRGNAKYKKILDTMAHSIVSKVLSEYGVSYVIDEEDNKRFIVVDIESGESEN